MRRPPALPETCTSYLFTASALVASYSTNSARTSSCLTSSTSCVAILPLYSPPSSLLAGPLRYSWARPQWKARDGRELRVKAVCRRFQSRAGRVLAGEASPCRMVSRSPKTVAAFSTDRSFCDYQEHGWCAAEQLAMSEPQANFLRI